METENKEKEVKEEFKPHPLKTTNVIHASEEILKLLKR